LAELQTQLQQKQMRTLEIDTAAEREDMRQFQPKLQNLHLNRDSSQDFHKDWSSK